MRRRVALVGAGSMGRNHARVVRESPGAELTAIVDPHEEVARPLAERLGAAWVPTIDQLPDVDAAIVAAPTELHRTVAAELIARGLPLLIEKPVCPSLKQTREIVGASAAAGVPLMCGFLERYNPAVAVARRLIDEPRYVRAERHSPYTPRIRTGVAWDLLVHDVDLITQLFGGAGPENISAQIGYFHPESVTGSEDVAEATLLFPGGGIASASASRIGQRKVRSIVVQSLAGTVEIDLLRRVVVRYRHTVLEDDAAGGYRQATEMEAPEVTGGEPLAVQFERFLGLIGGEVDADAERRSILPAHEIVEHVIAAGRVATATATSLEEWRPPST